MVISKVLNNNVVVVNENGKEEIVMGRGLAYKKTVGDEINEDMIDKVYTLSSKDISSKFQKLLENIPLEHMELSDEIISYAKMNLGKKLNESIYISLTDHIYTAIQRYKEGITIKNILTWDIKRFYKDEFKIGLKALEMIEERFKIQFTNDEAGFIALHIVNSEMEEEFQDIYGLTKMMHEITNIVKYYFKIEFDEDSVYYYRFITHLKFFSQRLISGNIYKDEKDDNLLEIIKTKYINAYDCVNNISEFIFKTYNYELTNEEKFYLTIHIARIVEKTEE